MGNPSLTPEEVAAALSITKQTVYEMVKRGELSAYRIGRKIRVEESELNRYKEDKQKSAVYAEKIDDSVFVISGQDVLLDILARYIEAAVPGSRILRSYKGSYNGLYDLYQEKVNVASAHLWDGDSNTYNGVYVKGLLPGVPAKIIHLAKRKQGFYVKEGNPKSIVSWEDLGRADITFINREKGSGTRVLLDEHLRLLNKKTQSVNGYHNIVTTHIQVAAAVARGFADFGLGSEKGVKQVGGLEFIPLQQENYDLVIREADLDLPLVHTLLKIIDSSEYKNEILNLGGYEIGD